MTATGARLGLEPLLTCSTIPPRSTPTMFRTLPPPADACYVPCTRHLVVGTHHSDRLFGCSVVLLFRHSVYLHIKVNEVTVEQLVQQYPHITFSTVLQDCKRTLERAYQMGWTPNMSAASS
ncbi:F-box/LRR-repeat protein 17 [Myotis davidii]|uniref:F-box/LRR-repeat protein 17 n=1 Tax=Myotis davidii TaxID=225400 RepID=L5MHV0_MYODS|nr:F-box/LRR-repeat protein 17 [Myotis davidii]